MSKRVPSTEERALAERLRREAIESCPAFSESLHERIAGAVRQFHAVGIAHHRAITAKRWRRGLAAVLAAACLFAAIAIGWQLIGIAPRQGTVNAPQEVAGPSIEDLRRKLNAAAGRHLHALGDERWIVS